MEKRPITKEAADKIMQLKGEARGVCLKSDMDFLVKYKGEDSLIKMEERLKELGYPMKYDKISTAFFYPIGQDILDMLVIWEFFDYDDSKIRQMGYEAPNFSIFLKIFLKYFVSIKDTLGQAPSMQKKHYTVGNMKIVEVDEKNKKVILRMEDFDLHPFMCLALEGYFAKVCQMMVRGGNASCKEIECTFRGGKTHEYLLTW